MSNRKFAHNKAFIADTLAMYRKAGIRKTAAEIRLNIEIGEKVGWPVIDKITSTHLDNLPYLTKLKDLPWSEQLALVETDLTEMSEMKTITHDLDGHAVRIRGLLADIRDSVFEIGRHLTEAKKLAGHGGWLPWLEKELAWSERTAQNYMQAHEWGLANPQRVAYLGCFPVNAIFELSAPSTAPEVSTSIIDRAKSGEKITRKTVVEAKKAFKPGNARHTLAEIEAMSVVAPDIFNLKVLSPPSERANYKETFLSQPYVKPADKYLAAQEAKLGPVKQEAAALPIDLAEIKGGLATLSSLGTRLGRYVMTDFDEALALAKRALESRLAA